MHHSNKKLTLEPFKSLVWKLFGNDGYYNQSKMFFSIRETLTGDYEKTAVASFMFEG